MFALSWVLGTYLTSKQMDESLLKNLGFQNSTKCHSEVGSSNEPSTRQLILPPAQAGSSPWTYDDLELPELIFPVQTGRLGEGFVTELWGRI